MSRYEMHDTDEVEKQWGLIRDELLYTEVHEVSSIPITLDALTLLGDLLLDLAEIGMRAPGGHGFTLEEANRWGALLKGQIG